MKNLKKLYKIIFFNVTIILLIMCLTSCAPKGGIISIVNETNNKVSVDIQYAIKKNNSSNYRDQEIEIDATKNFDVKDSGLYSISVRSLNFTSIDPFFSGNKTIYVSNGETFIVYLKK
jgi:hypothetical protein